jgi:DNA-directed RNA polymerase specialized sigma24 family protein
MTLYTRYEHGNVPVHVRRGVDGQTIYEMKVMSDRDATGRSTLVFTSARQLLSSIYGHDTHIPFDRYFRIGKYRQPGRASGQASIITLLDSKDATTRRTSITVHAPRVRSAKTTPIAVFEPAVQGTSNLPATQKTSDVKLGEGVKTPLDEGIEEFVEAMRKDLRPLEEFLEATPERLDGFTKSFELELDRVEGLVGISLGAVSARSGSKTKADEVRRLLWRGFAGKMLSQGYDPEDVLQEVYRGLLVRNNGRCPWDARKSTFGHYVTMVIGCVLTNYHRKQIRRTDRDALPLTGFSKEGDEVPEVMVGAVEIHDGCELGDMLALEGLAKHLERVKSEEPEAALGRRILALVASGHQRSEIVRATGEKPSLVSRALAWLRSQAAIWAARGGLGGHVPAKYRVEQA